VIAADTSAIVAIAFAEPERERFVRIIDQANRILISSVSAVEARMVVYGRRGHRAVVLVEDLLRLPKFEIVAPDAAQTEAAFAAFIAYGKGSGHPASLNFGDIFSYALAKVRSVPLLYKGADFSQTDIASAGSP
jgi:ribonuclease VapC